MPTEVRMAGETRRSLLRNRVDGAQRVTNIELFFDLIYVFAVTQLARLLGQHLDGAGALHATILLVAVWWAWVCTAWATNWLHPDLRPVRIMLIMVMMFSLIAAVALPSAFGERAPMFAIAYVATQIGRTLFLLHALRHEPELLRNFQRILTWLAVSGSLWIVGGFVPGAPRDALWLLAVAVDYGGPAFGFVVPGLGRSATADWTIAGTHLAERCQLFVIIALGESILDNGVTLSNRGMTTPTVAACVLGFLGTVALWWIYFDRHAEDSNRAMATSTDPGRLGRSAYTYFHVPIVAGIIVAAVAGERVVDDPTGHLDTATVAVMLIGPGLFLAGHLLFKRAVFGDLSLSRLGALVALGVLVPVSRLTSPLVLAGLIDVVIAAVAVADLITYRHLRRDVERDEAGAAQ